LTLFRFFLGCKDHKTFKYNQQFLFNVAEKQEAIIAVYQSESEDFENIGFYVVKTEELAAVEKVLSTNIVGKGPFAFVSRVPFLVFLASFGFISHLVLPDI
jgi:hypothetical protein